MTIYIRKDMSNLFDMKEKMIHISDYNDAIEIVLEVLEKTYRFPDAFEAANFMVALTCCYETGRSAGYNEGYLDS